MTAETQSAEKVHWTARLVRPLGVCLGLGLIVLGVMFATRPAQFDNLRIRGTKRFQEQVVTALAMLRNMAPEAYQIVTNNVGAIAQSKHSGMAAYRKPPTFELNDKTAYYSVTWCAGSIAHDSLHARFYFNYLKFHPGGSVVPNDAWMGEASEKLCSAHQLRVLRQIGAPAREIDHCISIQTNRYWELDYNKRNW